MSTKRKWKRAAKARAGKASSPEKTPADASALRGQLETERFRVPGSDKLWIALLGWSEARAQLAWVAQTVHDGVRHQREGAANLENVRAQLERRAPEAARQLTDEQLQKAVDLWQAGGAEHRADDPAPVWHYLCGLGHRLGVAECTPERLSADWDVFCRLELAAPPRKALMEALAHAESSAMSLQSVTESDPVAATAQTIRILWSAMAYGDEDSFRRLQDFVTEWLSREGVRSVQR